MWIGKDTPRLCVVQAGKALALQVRTLEVQEAQQRVAQVAVSTGPFKN